jgi:uncharacterized NAD-dependent epimerase/dehydratase family protein
MHLHLLKQFSFIILTSAQAKGAVVCHQPDGQSARHHFQRVSERLQDVRQFSAVRHPRIAGEGMKWELCPLG